MNASHQRILIETARKSIEKGLNRPGQEPWMPVHDGVDSSLLEPGAVFVTLFDHDGQLRGCIGSLQARRPLLDDVAHNAHQAAFGDHRFPPLTEAELPGLQIEISILSPLKPFFPRSESEFFDALVPGVSGLMIRKGVDGATFLPSVWEQLPSKSDFFEALKRKAGINTDGFDPDLEFFIYSVEKIKPDEF